LIVRRGTDSRTFGRVEIWRIIPHCNWKCFCMGEERKTYDEYFLRFEIIIKSRKGFEKIFKALQNPPSVHIEFPYFSLMRKSKPP
jgi:hypothetical protein